MATIRFMRYLLSYRYSLEALDAVVRNFATQPIRYHVLLPLCMLKLLLIRLLSLEITHFRGILYKLSRKISYTK